MNRATQAATPGEQPKGGKFTNQRLVTKSKDNVEMTHRMVAEAHRRHCECRRLQDTQTQSKEETQEMLGGSTGARDFLQMSLKKVRLHLALPHIR